jgi:predicted negative regulator of RcsB-dependent stress response
MKKIVKKQLKEDEFVSTLTKIFRFVKKRTKEIIIVGAAVIFFVLLYFGLHFLQLQNVKKESQLLSELLELRSELATKPEDVAKLEQLAGNGKFTRLGYVLLATYWVDKGDPAKAKASLEKMPAEPKDFLYYQAEDLLGQVNTLEKNYDQAIAIYNKIEQEKPKDYALDVVLFHKAAALEGKGARQEAVTVYKKVQEEFPQSYYGYDAAERVRKLEAAQQPSL